jgi:hypothetical protein
MTTPEEQAKGIPLDPIEPTQIAPNVTAIPLAPTVWDDLPDGQHAVTPDGTVWQRRDGLWFADPWWQREDAEQVIAVCAAPDEWAYGLGWTRKHVEDTSGPLTPIALPDASYPHDDGRCRQDSVDAAGFREACRAMARLAEAAGLSDSGLGFAEVADAVIKRLGRDR